MRNRKIKGILIDVKDLNVEEVKFENSLQGFYEKLNCDCITAVAYPLDKIHEIVVDDESLMKPLKNFFAFTLEETKEEYCGNGMIVGFDESGNWTNHLLNIEEIRKQIHFFKYICVNENIIRITLK